MSLQRLRVSLAWKCFPWADLNLKLSSGVRLCLQNRADFPVMQEIFIEQGYAPFIARLPEIRTWVDLGCNCGLFSLWLEHLARERHWPGPRRVLLVDANRIALRSLRASIKKNQLTDSFRLIEGAVGGRAGTVEFYESKSTYKSSVFSLTSGEKKRLVPVVDLDHEGVFDGAGPDLVKVDIEGAETLLFDHWPDWVRRARHLLVEWHEPHMGGRALDAICNRLGFRLVLSAPAEHLKTSTQPHLDLPIGYGLWSKNNPAD